VARSKNGVCEASCTRGDCKGGMNGRRADSVAEQLLLAYYATGSEIFSLQHCPPATFIVWPVGETVRGFQ
jgi:hypothetical protein